VPAKNVYLLETRALWTWSTTDSIFGEALKLCPDHLVSIKDAVMPFSEMRVLGFCFSSTVAYHIAALVKRIICFCISKSQSIISS